MMQRCKSGSLGKDTGNVVTSVAPVLNTAKHYGQKPFSKRNWHLLGKAQYILQEWDVKNKTGSNKHRTRMCHAARSQHVDYIGINVAKAQHVKAASLTGTIQCGNPFLCPICTPRIAIGRAKEIGKALAWARETKHTPIMMTLTASHTKEMPLCVFLEMFRKAWRAMTQFKRWRKLKAHLALKYLIRSTEVTYGENGWHYHYHFLLFVPNFRIKDKDEKIPADWQKQVQDAWLYQLSNAGLSGVGEIACHFSTHGNVAAEYVSKLGLEPEKATDVRYELTSGHNKNQSIQAEKGLNIFQILRIASEGSLDHEELYVEFAKAMAGQHFVYWSPHFKKLVGADDIDNEKLAEETGLTDFVRLMILTDEEYAPVRRQRAYADLLQVAGETKDPVAVRVFLAELKDADNRERVEMIADLEVKFAEAKSECLYHDYWIKKMSPQWAKSPRKVDKEKLRKGKETRHMYHMAMRRYSNTMAKLGRNVADLWMIDEVVDEKLKPEINPDPALHYTQVALFDMSAFTGQQKSYQFE